MLKTWRREVYKDGERLFTRTVTKQKNGDIEIYTTKKRFSQKYEGEGLILHPNGQVKVRSWYKNGRVDGPSLTYYEDGKRQCVCRYKNDVRDGEQFVFYHNGQLYTHEVWKEGRLMARREHFDERGNALEIGTLSEGNGTLIVYDDSGEKIGFMTCKNGKPTKKKVQKFPKQQ